MNLARNPSSGELPAEDDLEARFVLWLNNRFVGDIELPELTIVHSAQVVFASLLSRVP